MTAKMTAAGRACESERPDRLFNDPLARALAGEEAFSGRRRCGFCARRRTTLRTQRHPVRHGLSSATHSATRRRAGTRPRKAGLQRDCPNRLWLTDLRHVGGRADMAYVCSIADAFSRMITGWRIAVRLGTDMVLDALEIARRQRRAGRRLGLVTHSDTGSQLVHLGVLQLARGRDRDTQWLLPPQLCALRHRVLSSKKWSFASASGGIGEHVTISHDTGDRRAAAGAPAHNQWPDLSTRHRVQRGSHDDIGIAPP